MRPIAVLIIVLLPCFLGAQIPAEVEDYIDKFGTNNLNDRAENTIGSPFVFEEFMTGYVYFSDNTRSTERMINYNCHDNQVLYQEGENTYMLNARMIDSLEFRIDENTSWIFRKVTLKDDGDPLFMNVLYRDHSILYKRHDKEFREADIGQAYGSGQRNDEYIDRHDYYFAVEGSDVQHLRPRKRNVLEIMEAHGEEIEDFLKKDKINLRSEDDLIRLVRYYDSLATRSQ
jgi:hypothetical protein